MRTIELEGPASGQPHAPDIAPADDADATTDEPLVLACRACGHTITTSAERTERDGAHAHVFFNPAGILFRIGCFVEAPGCRGIGPFETDFTWFAAHAWQVVVCRGCGAHLGWFFAGATRFFGLVLDRLVETGPASPT